MSFPFLPSHIFYLQETYVAYPGVINSLHAAVIADTLSAQAAVMLPRVVRGDRGRPGGIIIPILEFPE